MKHNSYASVSKKVNIETLQYLQKLLKGFNKPSYKFVVHLLISMESARILWENEGYVPVPSTFIKSHFDRADVKGLIANNIVEKDGVYRRPRDGRKGKCYYYRVVFNIFCRYLHLMEQDSRCTTEYNLITGKKMAKRKIRKSRLINTVCRTAPELIEDSVKHIPRCLCNSTAVELHLQKLHQLVSVGKYPEKGLLIDRRAYLQIKHNQTAENNGIITYTPSYSLQSTGRISEVGTGLQSCSREMKEAAFSGIANIHNYDLKSSQIHILIQYLKREKIDAIWLEKYLTQPKRLYAEYIGIDVDTWKACLMAVVMGCYLPPIHEIQLTTMHDKQNAPYYLYEYCKVHNKDFPAVYTTFCQVVQPLVKARNQFMHILVNDHISSYGYIRDGKRFLRNNANMVFCLEDHEKHEAARKLMAFYLQGKEATFVHYLTTLSTKHGFEVISNQHDGLVTLGSIPAEAIKEASEYAGITVAVLVEKAFV